MTDKASSSTQTAEEFKKHENSLLAAQSSYETVSVGTKMETDNEGTKTETENIHKFWQKTAKICKTSQLCSVV